MSFSVNFGTIKPSLNLDFANTKALDPRVTFTRASSATFYDGVTTAKAEENLFLYSQNFANSIWTVTGSTRTSTTETDPAGGSTALLLTKVSDSAYSLRQYSSAGNSASRTFTFSFYLKGVAGETVRLYMDNGVNQSFTTTVTLTADWVRYTFTNTFNSTSGSVTGGVSFNTGLTATSVYVAFAQVEERSSVTAYTATTTQPITNYIPVLRTAAAGVPRFDHNPTTDESLGLLIEEQRTNLLTYSAQFDDAAWGKTAISVSANAVVAPDGTLTGDKLIPDTTTGNHRVSSANVSWVNGTSYAFTFYAKAGEYSTAHVYDGTWTGAPVAYFDLTTGVATKPASTLNPSVVSMTLIGNGWYRCTMVATALSTTTSPGFSRIGVGATSSITGNGYSGVYIWGAQLEAGAFPTSYIATVGSQVTRSADAATMTGTNFSSWYNPGEGTVCCTFRGFGIVSNRYPRVYAISDGTDNNQLTRILDVSGNTNFFSSTVGGVTQAAITTSSPANNTLYTVSDTYKLNDFAASVNGASAGIDTSALVPVVNNLNIGASGNSGNRYNGTIRKISYYPLRLTNAQLQALTTV